jgi:MraZ protein
MFYGEYEHTIDDKSRLTLPARFRESFVDGVVLSKGLDRNVVVYPVGAWEKYVGSRMADLDPLSREARELLRFFFSGGSNDQLDRQGRVLVPQALLRYANLEKDVVVAGVYDHLEVWDRRAWAEHLKEVEGSAGHVAERVANERS